MTVKELRTAIKGIKPNVEVRINTPQQNGNNLECVKSITYDENLNILRINKY